MLLIWQILLAESLPHGSARHVAECIRTGEVQRIRYGWLTTVSVDPSNPAAEMKLSSNGVDNLTSRTRYYVECTSAISATQMLEQRTL